MTLNEGIAIRDRLQAAWDAVTELPPIDFTVEEAIALAAALNAPTGPVEKERGA